jgi:hypothetical protein
MINDILENMLEAYKKAEHDRFMDNLTFGLSLVFIVIVVGVYLII